MCHTQLRHLLQLRVRYFRALDYIEEIVNFHVETFVEVERADWGLSVVEEDGEGLGRDETRVYEDEGVQVWKGPVTQF